MNSVQFGDGVKDMYILEQKKYLFYIEVTKYITISPTSCGFSHFKNLLPLVWECTLGLVLFWLLSISLLKAILIEVRYVTQFFLYD